MQTGFCRRLNRGWTPMNTDKKARQSFHESTRIELVKIREIRVSKKSVSIRVYPWLIFLRVEG